MIRFMQIIERKEDNGMNSLGYVPVCSSPMSKAGNFTLLRDYCAFCKENNSIVLKWIYTELL